MMLALSSEAASAVVQPCATAVAAADRGDVGASAQLDAAEVDMPPIPVTGVHLNAYQTSEACRVDAWYQMLDQTIALRSPSSCPHLGISLQSLLLLYVAQD